jgi:ubiquinone/menaquinone biosynthesis C-methylase UbiE
MDDWIKKVFVEYSDVFLRFLDERWPQTEDLVNGMISVLNEFGINSGRMLDCCCGNGRISIYMAKNGYKAVGIDISKAFLEVALKKACENGVSNLTEFLEGDVRKLKKVIGNISELFDIVVSAWDSIGYFSRNQDLLILKQMRELSKKGAILFILDTAHKDYVFRVTSRNRRKTADAVALAAEYRSPKPRGQSGGSKEQEVLVVLENREYDLKTSTLRRYWTLYDKLGEDLRLRDRLEMKIHVYSLSELSILLGKAGWKLLASYGNLATLQPLNPLTRMNLVARAE